MKVQISLLQKKEEASGKSVISFGYGQKRMEKYTKHGQYGIAPTYLLLPLGKRGWKWGDFHWAMGCV